MSLERFQRDLAAALFDPRLPPPQAVVADDMSTEARLSVHRGNVRGSLIRALHASYPIVASIAGDALFEAMAWTFIRAHPPRRSWLSAYGDRFPGFIATFEPAGSLPCLPDLARLERLVRLALAAPEEKPVAPESLAAIGPADLLSWRPRLHPSTGWLVSNHPVHAIWEASREECPLASPVSRADRPHKVLVVRSEGGLVVRELSSGELAILRTLRHRSSLGRAIAVGLEVEAGVDIAARFMELVRIGAFAAR